MVIETRRPPEDDIVELSSDDSGESDDHDPAPPPLRRKMNNVIHSDDDSDEAPNSRNEMPGAFPSRSGTSTGAEAVATSNYPKLPSMMDGSAIKMPEPRPTPANARPGSGFVGGFAPHLQGPQQSHAAPNFLNRPIAASSLPPTNSYKPPSNPPPLANNRFQPISAAHPTGATAIRVPQAGSSQSQLLAALSKVPHALPQVPHAILHGHNPGSPQYPSQQASIIRPPPGGEFASIDNVQARPGEIIGDWDELITDIKATAEEVAEDYNEEDTIVPGFNEGVKLRAWQVQGRHWMLARESGGKRGGILADDMGLGKTVQMITLVTLNPRTSDEREDGWARGTLIVVGLNILGQWETEIKKFNSDLRVLAHHGPSRTKRPADLEKYHVVLTTYDVLSNEHAVYEDPTGEGTSRKKKGKDSALSPIGDDSDSDGFGGSLKARKEALLKSNAGSRRKVKEKGAALFGVDWLRVVVDEGQNIKNRNSKRSLAASALNSKYRWVLTGTPIQNNVEDLYALLRFLRIKPLHDWNRFNETIRKPIMAGRSGTPLKKLHLILKAIMLRRLKSEIDDLNLPPRTVQVAKCEFEESEQFVYDQLRTIAEEKIDKAMEAHDMISALVLLLRLRQACDHPTLTKLTAAEDVKEMGASTPASARSPKPGSDSDSDELTGLMQAMTVVGHCENCHAVLKPSEETYCRGCAPVYRETGRRVTDVTYRSTKIRKMLELLRAIENQHDPGKTIIFSEFVKMLDIVAGVLKEEGMRFVRYDGTMNAPQRQVALDAIKQDPRVKIILISTKAGNSGLNLTCCSNVIMTDPWWNPAIEDQAFDRAHRLGQTREVQIHKLMVPETVEERILELQEKKRALAKAALEGGKLGKKQNKLDFSELFALFKHGHHDD